MDNNQQSSKTLPANVVNILKNINEEINATNSDKPEQSKKLATKRTKKEQSKIPRGQPKSGRPWKTPKQKFSGIKKSIYRHSKQKKDELREEIRHIKELSRSIKEERKMDNQRKKERREENARIRLENERKAEIVQIIKNPAKLKRMKKKALRKIEKRDLSNVKVV